MYKELIEHSTDRRNKIVPQHEIKVFPADYERYCSMFSFDSSMVEWVKATKSVGGFKGIIYSDVLWIDIDVKGNIQEAQKLTLTLIQHLMSEYHVSPTDLFIYFSGNKGFHIALHGKLFGEFKPSADLPKKIKALAHIISGGVEIDTKIYEPVRFFRIVNSRHAESKLYKIEISFDELQNLTAEQIKDIAKNPRIDFKREKALSSVFKNDALAKIWDNIKFSEVEIKNRDGVGFWEATNDGNRHTQLYRQAAMLFDKSELSKNAIYDIMFAINQQCTPPIEDLRSVVESAFKKTSLNIKKQDLVLKPFAGWVEEYVDYIFHPTSELTTGFPSFDNALRKKLKGKLGCIVGYGGSKKSLFALNACLANSLDHNSHSIYSTMEMSTNQLMNRIVDYIVDGDLTNASYELERQNREWAAKFLGETVAPVLGNKVMITQNSSLTCKDYDNLIERALNETGRMDLLVVDGLSMMGGDGKEVERYSDNSKELKELANKWNILVLLICHVSKGADKHTRDLTDKVRGSEKIFDNCDFVITLSQLIDMVNSGDGITEYLKDKGYARFYDKRGSGQTINKIFQFNPMRLTLSETSENPSSYEAEGKRKNEYTFE